MLTKTRMHYMQEDSLRREVLIPLLEAMHHCDVTEYHGGSGEQGKDIVSWQPDQLGTRVNYAFVVKATNITGQANTRKGNAGEVNMQVQQCFGQPFLDPITTEERTVHECWVVTNKNISKDADMSIRSALAVGNLDRHIRLIDGEKLWKLVEEHLPPARVWQRLQEASEVLESVDPHYRPTVQVSGSNVVLGVEEKYPGAFQQQPFQVGLSINPPPGEEGSALRESMEQFIKTGAEVEIPGQYAKVELPENFARLIDPGAKNLQSLRMGPMTGGPPFLAQLEFACDDGDSMILPYVHFVVVQGGTDEITLANDGQPIATRVKLILRPKDGAARLNMSLPPLPLNVNQVAEGLRLQTCVGKPFTVRVIHLDTGLTAMELHADEGFMEAPPTKLVEAINDLATIQKKVGVLITMPARDLSTEETQVIGKLREILHDGQVQGTWSGKVFAANTADGIQSWLANSGGDNLLQMPPVEESVTLFGATIPLGPAQTTFAGAKLANEADVRAKLAAATDSEIECEFVPSSEAEPYAVEVYLAWTPPSSDQDVHA